MQKRKRINAFSTQKRGKSNSFFSLQTKKITKSFKRRIVSQKASSVMLIIGLCLVLLGGLQSIQAHSKPVFDGEIRSVYSAQGFYAPTRITISSVNIDLPIKKTFIDKGEWEISEIGVSHLATSSNLDIDGNIILYGHNTLDMLGNLHSVKLNDQIVLKDSKGKNYTYSVSSIQVVDPSDIDKLSSFDGQTLSIYTCTGFADLKRLLIKAYRAE